MEKIQPVAGTRIKFFETPNFKEMEELVNKWIDETGNLRFDAKSARGQQAQPLQRRSGFDKEEIQLLESFRSRGGRRRPPPFQARMDAFRITEGFRIPIADHDHFLAEQRKIFQLSKIE